MSAAAILYELRQAGVTVRAEEWRVFLAPRERVTRQMLELVRAHKPAILALLTPIQLPAPTEISAAQQLRRALEPRRLGVRPFYTPGQAARWQTYDWDHGQPVYRADTLEALAARYGVEIVAQGRPS